MAYRDQLHALGDDCERAVLAIFDAYTDRALDRDDTVALIAGAIARANSRAVALADLSLAATLMLQLGAVAVVRGLTPPPGDGERLAKGATTLLAIPDVTRERVGRFARAEPLESAARAYSEAIRTTPSVTGWTRDTGPTPCELCRWWARDGRVWPDNHEMPTHKGCTCTPTPVTR